MIMLHNFFIRLYHFSLICTVRHKSEYDKFRYFIRIIFKRMDTVMNSYNIIFDRIAGFFNSIAVYIFAQ